MNRTSANPLDADPVGAELQALLSGPDQPADAYLALGRKLHAARRFAEAGRLIDVSLQRHPQSSDLWNLRGVLLRVARRPADALAALDRALALAPGSPRAAINRGNVLLDLGDGEGALAAFSGMLALSPDDPMLRNLVGRACLSLGRVEDALSNLRAAVEIKPDFAEAWLDLAGALNQLRRPADADATFVEALARNPDNLKLLEGRALVLRATGQTERAEVFLRDALQRAPNAAWLHFHLGDLLWAQRPDEGVHHLRRAHELEPSHLEHLLLLLQALERTEGGAEGARLDEAFGLAQRALQHGGLNPAQTALLRDIFVRVCAFDRLDALGAFEDLGRSWAKGGLHGALLRQIAQATTADRRQELLSQHRIWGEAAEAHAGRTPIQRPTARDEGGKIRLGFMSSDLRNHAVGYFALSLFDHIDRSRFEVSVYSYYRGPNDALQAHVARQVDGFRSWPDITPREAAQRIADDQLDMLIELGGSTSMNKIEVMAWRPAPLQASWLGYPHSSGLSTIDYFICDPHNRPTAPELLLERPLTLPRSWIATSDVLLAKLPPVDPALPADRKGHITYGTANNPHKYTPQVLAAWAKVVAATPGSHFAFIRPEAGSQAFRGNVEAAFAAHGVSADRLDWHAVRGAHLPRYGEVDISLDTFPLTGGTTTVEALQMGVPVVSLSGQAFHERLSASILTNAELADLAVDTVEAFQATAVALAADRNRRAELRATLRARIAASPLGDPIGFARDFFDMIEAAVLNARS